MINLVGEPAKEDAPIKHFDGADDLPDCIKQLISEATAARERASARFSNFLVGSALLTGSGRIHRGSNSESSNADTLCAERAALCVARNTPHEHHPLVVRRIAIIGGPRDFSVGTTPLTPCGRCRQFILDQEREQRSPIQIICATLGGGPIKIFSGIAPLLPYAFGDELPPSK